MNPISASRFDAGRSGFAFIAMSASHAIMDMDGLLREYFGTSSLENVPDGARSAGVERMLVDLGLERDRGARFALWSLLYMLESAPDLDVAFPDPADRDAARNLMDLLAAGDGTGNC